MFAENVTKAAIEQAASDCAEMGYQTEMLSLSAADPAQTTSDKGIGLLAYADDKSQLCSTINAKVAGMSKFQERLRRTYPGEPRVVDGVADRMERYEAIGEWTSSSGGSSSFAGTSANVEQ